MRCQLRSWKADIAIWSNWAVAAGIFSGPNMNGNRFALMPHDADYFRARAIEERGRAKEADRVYLAMIHKELAKQLDRRAEECDSEAEQFDGLAKRAFPLIKDREC